MFLNRNAERFVFDDTGAVEIHPARCIVWEGGRSKRLHNTENMQCNISLQQIAQVQNLKPSWFDMQRSVFDDAGNAGKLLTRSIVLRLSCVVFVGHLFVCCLFGWDLARQRTAITMSTWLNTKQIGRNHESHRCPNLAPRGASVCCYDELNSRSGQLAFVNSSPLHTKTNVNCDPHYYRSTCDKFEGMAAKSASGEINPLSEPRGPCV